MDLYSTGVGVAIGGHSPLGGWTVDAPMAESPAEEAGIRRGERILAVGAHLSYTCCARLVKPALARARREFGLEPEV